MKKVLDVMPYQYLPYFSGGQKSIAQFLDYLGQETELSVITVPGNEGKMAVSYRLFPMLKKGAAKYYDFSLIAKIADFVKREQIQTIIWEHPYYAWLAFSVRKRTGVSTIFHTHNIEYQRFRSLGKWWWPILRIYEKWAFKKADAIFFIAPEELSFATTRWNIDKAKCKTVPFGVPVNENPADRDACSDKVRALHHISADEKILLFNGLLSYQPNLDALKYILDHVNPLLEQESDFRYRIVICGKGLPAEMEELKSYKSHNVVYAGFVDDIEMYFKAADIFLNPVQTGGGIKTKMVEAIAYGTTVVATESGAAGIERTACGNKLAVVPDNDWQGFVNAILAADISAITPASYFETYYWGDIAKKVTSLL